IQEGLHWRFAEAPTSLMRTLLIVLANPQIKIGLQLIDRTIYLFAEGDTVELVEHRSVEALTDAVRLRAVRLGARVIDVLHREVELVFVALRVAAVLAAAIGKHAQQLDIVLIEERQHAVIEQIRGRDRRFAIVQLGGREATNSVIEIERERHSFTRGSTHLVPRVSR